MTVLRQQFNNLSGYLYELTGDTTVEDLIGISDELRVKEDIVFAVLDFNNASLGNLSLQDYTELLFGTHPFPIHTVLKSLHW